MSEDTLEYYTYSLYIVLSLEILISTMFCLEVSRGKEGYNETAGMMKTQDENRSKRGTVKETEKKKTVFLLRDSDFRVRYLEVRAYTLWH